MSMPINAAYKQFTVKANGYQVDQNKFVFDQFKLGAKLSFKGKVVLSMAELLSLPLDQLQIEPVCCLHAKTAGIDAAAIDWAERIKAIQTQPTVRVEAETAFYDGNHLECPHCDTKMVEVKLAGGQQAVYCPSCRHTDFAPQDKAAVHAGAPSTEKSIRLTCVDSGNCKIDEKKSS